MVGVTPPSTPVQGLLGDVRVLDLAGETGVFAGRVLAELGADVVRIEAPGGDAVRHRPPFLDAEPGTERSLHHLHFNAGKRSLTLDLGQREGVALLVRLAEHADVLIETATPGAMDALGAGFETLRQANPGLLYGTITPFGQEGPMAQYRGTDLIGAATSGLMWLNGFPEDPPVQPGAEQAYHISSMALVAGLLVALVGRDRDSVGHRVDVSMQEATSMATYQHASPNAYTWHGVVPRRYGLTGAAGGRHLYQCADGEWLSFVITPYRWDDFVQWLRDEGIEAGVDGPEWRDQVYRQRHQPRVAAAIQALVAKHPRSHLVHEGQRRMQLTMPSNTPADLLRDEQLAARDYFVELEDEVLGRTLTDAGTAFRFSGAPAGIARRAPRLGEHTEAVLGGLLEIGPAELEGLRARGVV